MRRLEARFFPVQGDGADYIVVGHVVWNDADDQVPSIRAAASLAVEHAPATIFATLLHLVRVTTPHSFQRLLALRNRFWSFVDVDEAAAVNDNGAERLLSQDQ